MKKISLLLSAMVLPMANLTTSDGLSARAVEARDWLFDFYLESSTKLLSTIFKTPNDNAAVQLLIHQDANVNFFITEFRTEIAGYYHSITPLHALYCSALHHNLTLFPLATLQTLLDAGADPEKRQGTRH